MNMLRLLLSFIPALFLFPVFSPPLVYSNSLLDATFTNIYPKDFQDTYMGKATIFAGGITLTPLTGGFSVYAVAGDVILTIADIAHDKYNPGKNNNFQQVKIKLPKRGNKSVLKDIENMESLKSEFQKNNVDPSFFSVTVHRYYDDALKKLRHINDDLPEAGYDYLLKTIIQYNRRDYESAKVSLNECQKFFKNKSVIYYIKALLYLVEGDIKQAKRFLYKSIRSEKNATKSYALLVQLLIDEGQFEEARKLALKGVSKDKNKNYYMPFAAGSNCFYNLKNYNCAIFFFKIALKYTGINENEAECKFMIGKSSQKLGKKVKADRWFSSCINEIKKNPQLKKEYTARWNQ